jgi:bla regulator protein blaR1
MKVRIAGFLLAASIAGAQAQPKFEVASIKPSNSADRRRLFDVQPGGRITVANFTVKRLIQQAYGIKDFQISGGPGWMGADPFDISTKPEIATTNFDQIKLMLQSLLAERFQLVVRRDTKEVPVYTLVVDKNGPKFKEATEADPNKPRVTIIRRGRLTAQGTDMRIFAGVLSGFLGRVVVDKTGLTGSYDVKLEWVPDENQVAMFQTMGVPEGFGAPAPDWHGPSLFAALPEQLGLKLESQKGPVEIFTIERIERPSEN